MTRLVDVRKLYEFLSRLRDRPIPFNGPGDGAWPRRGVYFFYDDLEPRSDSGSGPRIVRIGTHALTVGSKSTLRQRMAQHRGRRNGGGNHRGSIFRLLVGQALLARGDCELCASWGLKGDAGRAAIQLSVNRLDLTASERPIEQAVSSYLARLSFVCLAVDDDAGPNSLRGDVERNTIALLSNLERDAVDAPSAEWLGRWSNRDRVSGSGLWNQRHVDEDYDPAFLGRLAGLIERSLVRADATAGS